MDHLDDGHPILYTAAEKYIPVSKSTIKDTLKSLKDYKEHKMNFVK